MHQTNNSVHDPIHICIKQVLYFTGSGVDPRERTRMAPNTVHGQERSVIKHDSTACV